MTQCAAELVPLESRDITDPHDSYIIYHRSATRVHSVPQNLFPWSSVI